RCALCLVSIVEEQAGVVGRRSSEVDQTPQSDYSASNLNHSLGGCRCCWPVDSLRLNPSRGGVMNGSLDVRKFLRQQEDRLPRSSASVPAQRSGEPERISAEQVYRARMAVARSAADADDCRLLLEMLGLVPDEDGQLPVRR